MSTVKDMPETFGRLDYQIIPNGWFQLYLSKEVLGSEILWLETQGYEIVQFICSGLSTLLEQFRESFIFPDYFQHNFNSLNDCLRDLGIRGSGMAIVFKEVDSLEKGIAHDLLDIFVNMARVNFIVGEWGLILAQVNDNGFQADDIGAMRAVWNAKEWLNSPRA